jgi:hypothetical protein
MILVGIGQGRSAAQSPDKHSLAIGAARAEQMRLGVKSFRLDILHYGTTDNAFYNLTLSVPWLTRGAESPLHPVVLIDVDEARKIVGYLAESGALDKAQEGESIGPGRAPTTMHYVLNIQAEPKPWRKVVCQENLGWGLPMLDRLEGLRKVLGGDAARQMDLLLSRLGGYRKSWQREGEVLPAAQSAKPAGVIRSLQGWELYVWRQESSIYFSLLAGSNRMKTDEEIGRAAVKGSDTIRSRLDQLKPGETVSILGRRATGRPPKDAARTTAEYCRKIGLHVVLPSP